MKNYIVIFSLFLGLNSSSQLNFTLGTDVLRTSLNKDAFLSSIDLQPHFDEVNFKQLNTEFTYRFIKRKINFGTIHSLSIEREWIGRFLRKNSLGNWSYFFQYSRLWRINLGVYLSSEYQFKSVKLKSSLRAITDVRTIDWKKYNLELGVIHEGVFLTSAHSFTSLNLSFQQSFQLNKSEKNPLWFNLNMRYIPFTEYTYNQHTLWFGAGLGLEFNRSKSKN